MPILQIHQLKVAAVAKIICDSIPNFDETREVVTTCLLHDMGNIIKFDLGYFPDSVEPEGLEYWEKVQNEYIQKYGRDEHHATQMIIAELLNSEKIMDYANQVGFSKLQETKKDKSLAKKICAYSDMRVGPHGVISIQERVADGRKRYEGRRDRAINFDTFSVVVDALKEVERQVCGVSNMKPGDITDDVADKIAEELKNFEIV